MRFKNMSITKSFSISLLVIEIPAFLLIGFILAMLLRMSNTTTELIDINVRSSELIAEARLSSNIAARNAQTMVLFPKLIDEAEAELDSAIVMLEQSIQELAYGLAYASRQNYRWRMQRRRGFGYASSNEYRPRW